ncbi:hypothetical protein HDU97_005671 [Phlyctochytrium planicorne]|nr:hypothetical protein HDU97_005671 [Phlyctochytrium planicorne]
MSATLSIEATSAKFIELERSHETLRAQVCFLEKRVAELEHQEETFLQRKTRILELVALLVGEVGSMMVEDGSVIIESQKFGFPRLESEGRESITTLRQDSSDEIIVTADGGHQAEDAMLACEVDTAPLPLEVPVLTYDKAKIVEAKRAQPREPGSNGTLEDSREAVIASYQKSCEQILDAALEDLEKSGFKPSTAPCDKPNLSINFMDEHNGENERSDMLEKPEQLVSANDIESPKPEDAEQLNYSSSYAVTAPETDHISVEDAMDAICGVVDARCEKTADDFSGREACELRVGDEDPIEEVKADIGGNEAANVEGEVIQLEVSDVPVDGTEYLDDANPLSYSSENLMTERDMDSEDSPTITLNTAAAVDLPAIQELGDENVHEDDGVDSVNNVELYEEVAKIETREEDPAVAITASPELEAIDEAPFIESQLIAENSEIEPVSTKSESFYEIDDSKLEIEEPSFKATAETNTDCAVSTTTVGETITTTTDTVSECESDQIKSIVTEFNDEPCTNSSVLTSDDVKVSSSDATTLCSSSEAEPGNTKSVFLKAHSAPAIPSGGTSNPAPAVLAKQSSVKTLTEMVKQGIKVDLSAALNVRDGPSKSRKKKNKMKNKKH